MVKMTACTNICWQRMPPTPFPYLPCTAQWHIMWLATTIHATHANPLLAAEHPPLLCSPFTAEAPIPESLFNGRTTAYRVRCNIHACLYHAHSTITLVAELKHYIP